jgi:hypothetical protein
MLRLEPEVDVPTSCVACLTGVGGNWGDPGLPGCPEDEIGELTPIKLANRESSSPAVSRA